MTPRDSGVSVADDFFDDVERCPTEQPNLESLMREYSSSFSSLDFPFVDTRRYHVCLATNLHLILSIFFLKLVSSTWYKRLLPLLIGNFSRPLVLWPNHSS